MSNHRENETVDKFGRTVVVADGRNPGRTVTTAPAAAAREARVPGEQRKRAHSNAGGRFEEQQPAHQGQQGHGHFPRQQQQHQQQQNFHHGHDQRNDWEGQHRDVRYQERRDDYGGGGGNNRRNMNHQQALVQPFNPNRIAPILSFKSFMQQQRDDLPPEAFQRMYDQYHLNYLQDFSDRFFQESMMEEWFQDRYSPVRIQAQEEAAATRAAAESASLKESFLAHPVASVKAVCLDPPPHAKGKREPGNAEAPVTSEAAGEATGAMEEAGASDVPVASKHLPGHEDRTLYISGIHASCTRSALLNAITAALAPAVQEGETAPEGEEVPAPERFLFSQPVWTNMDGNDKFERFAWIVMPTVAAAKQALRKLHELRVEVPFPMEPADVEPAVEFMFTVHARPHMPKVYYEKFEICAHYQRVEADTVRALELAALLDEDRRVPEETRLAAILQSEAVSAALAKPTDRLDVAMAYLRRVHLVNFYGAKRFRDEAHLLSQSPSVPHRVKEYIPAPAVSEGTSMVTTDTAEEEAQGQQESAEQPPAPTVGGKRKHDDDEGDAAEAGMEVEGASKPPPPPGRPQRTVNLASPRMEAMLAEVREKVAYARRRAEDPSLPGSADEEDAKTLSALQDKTFDRCVQANLKPEKEGKCRCCYVSCNKLFKGADFLTKHMRLKHEDFALDLLLQDAAPFMRKRYEAEPMGARPLPPVEVEAHGRTELKSVKVILDKYMPQSAQPPREPREPREQAPRRAPMEGNRRGHDDRDRRNGREGGQGQAPVRQQAQYVQPNSEQNFSRKISSYVDVDAPKESAVSIEYGVALPPIKKRRAAPAAAVKKASSMDEGETA